MFNKLQIIGIIVFFTLLCFQAFAQEAEKTEQKPPQVRKIPGITDKDPFPGGCVDCHINYTDMNLDTRFSTLMKTWKVKVDSVLMQIAQDAAPGGMILKGKHPDKPESFNNIPRQCLMCHSKTSKTAPPFARMIHKIHLTGGEENKYLTIFQGECTYCHKLNLTSGTWTIPSGPEH